MTAVGFIYAIASGDAVKIGWSKDPWKRINNLQIGSSVDQRLVGFEEGSKEREAELHVQFDRFRIRGEWFRNECEVKAFVAGLPPLRAKPRKEPNRPKREWQRAPAPLPARFGPARRKFALDLNTVFNLWAEHRLDATLDAAAAYLADHPNQYTRTVDGCETMRVSYTEPLQFFSLHWPDGVEWPHSVVRPASNSKLASKLLKHAIWHLDWKKRNEEFWRNKHATRFDAFAGLTAGLVQ